MKLAAKPDESAQIQALEAVSAYTQTFNKMRFIETEERVSRHLSVNKFVKFLWTVFQTSDTMK